MNYKTNFFLFTFLLGIFFSRAQDSDLPQNHFIEHFTDRMDILGYFNENFQSSLKPLPREYVCHAIMNMDSSILTYRDLHNYFRTRYLVDDDFNDSLRCKPEFTYGLRKHFSWLYQNRRDLISYRSNNFKIYINPILDLRMGLEISNRSNSVPSLYQNTRGASFRIRLGNRLAFYSEVMENQVRLPSFVRLIDSTSVLRGGIFPGVGYWKPFKQNGLDFGLTKAYITYSPLNNLRIKLGRDRNFLGNGVQSLFLSNFAVDYWFTNFRLDLKKIQYYWQISQMVDFIPNKSDAYGRQPAKYSVHHQLFWNPRKNLSFSVFESVIYASATPNQSREFEWQYLNPLIFYRTVEQLIGSADNSLLGISFKWNFLKSLQTYGQLLIDDYNFGNRKVGKGWWGNKVGIQAGLKYINVATIDQLDFQIEFNQVSPYTYGHTNPASNYSHYGQFLAYTYGANARDFHAKLSYQPFPRFFISVDGSYVKKGLDMDGKNYGGNIFRTGNTHFQDYNNTILQGKLLDLKIGHAKISYQLFYTDIYFEIDAWYRIQNSIKEWVVLGGFRMGGFRSLWNF